MAPFSPFDWGDFRRLHPISDVWGIDRGGPLDRYYIEKFLARHRADISGRVLEVKDSSYTRAFGVGVTRADVLDVNPRNPNATFIADLTKPDGVPSATFDCVVLTQTLHQIFEIHAALSNVHRILKPGGVLLCTLPSVSRVDSHVEHPEAGESDYWRFTEAAVRLLFAEFFADESVSISVFGNVLICAGFLYGLAPQEFRDEELEFVDPWFPLIVCLRAVKGASPAGSPRSRD